MPLKVLGIGDNVADHYLDTGIIYPGGNAFNVAAYASMLGADAAYLGVFGDDFSGQHVHATAKEMGIDVSRCRILHGENGRPGVRLTEGERVFVSSNKGGISRLRPPVLDAKDLEYLAGFDLLHSSINSFMEIELPRMAAVGKPVSYDFSSHRAAMYFEAHCPYITYAIASCGDISEEQTRELIHRLHGWGSPYVIATRGGEGALFSDRRNIYRHTPLKIDAKDTMGAGDAFLTAFLLNWLEWLKLEETANDEERGGAIKRAMQVGASFAAKMCMVDGAFGHGVPYSET